MKNSPIFIIDDNEDDAILTKKALIDAKVPNETVHFNNSSDVLDYLLDESLPKPVLIILDLKITGNEFLRERINYSSLKIIPVIVLTAIDNTAAKTECFKLNSAGYMLRPSEYEDMVHAMEAIYQYWSYSEVAHTD